MAIAAKATAGKKLLTPQDCDCASSCGIHGHDDAQSWSAGIPASDLKSFWGALGCACWAV